MKKILFIRRDNIGDLICTTPAIYAVRQKYPDAKIGILVNSYNADAIINNPDIDEIYVYEKAKHVPEKNKLSVWWSNLKVLMRIRKEQYDVAIGCGSYSPRLVRYTYMTGAAVRIGYLSKNVDKSKSYNMPICEPEKPLHEVEMVFNLLSPLDINNTPSPLRIFPLSDETQKVKNFLNISDIKEGKPLITFHISSRRPENRWPIDKFIELARLIISRYDANILLLWSPGSEKNPYHPGDDEKAELIIKSVPQIIPYRTNHLRELIAVLSFANLVVCLDGGAMHIAAALGKPIVTIWGSTNPDRWRPWGVKHIILQDENKKAENISIEAVFNAVEKLLA
ncbi:glycosyl transferase family 9 [Dissulfurispira thermophila]|uniref:Glycosyl transferase family 9 n=1 Tax=Dissulfurispira thermophila TaxID=2715679 RepID=A0A7G1H3C8_9BACT|nr:glycosyltransferase family 9 protein [Dissulfurispira thermophila]BCB97305.1 glycosyl transferase family 9 [Dissulfurispira thermophila]